VFIICPELTSASLGFREITNNRSKMLGSTSNSRKQQLEELKSFTGAVNKEIADIVELLNWRVDSVTDVVG